MIMAIFVWIGIALGGVTYVWSESGNFVRCVERDYAPLGFNPFC